ncbi:MAG: hypothetical protein H0X27_13760 [Caulobacteraceae bacterium]|nr:hypothetical protein [Caulobacteraceae bacterium]
MTNSDPRADRLRALDALREAFVEACAERFEGGGGVAGSEIEVLAALSGAIAESVASWGRLLRRLDFAREGALDPRRAGALVLEAVFDDLVEPHAWRVLAAALDLAGP